MTGKLLELTIEGKDIYNPTAPFVVKGRKFIAARMESRNTERDSKIIFFEKFKKNWKIVSGCPDLPMQDPFVTKINDLLVFGGVKVNWESGTYRTEFYSGQDLYNLKYLTRGPINMKDIRLVFLSNGKLGVFTRPQGKVGGSGKIGFIEINDLDELNDTNIEQASLITNQFGSNQWGGVNQAILLSDTKVGVLGHVAEFDPQGNKLYSAMAFVFDPVSKTSTEMKIIATREDFPQSEIKRSDLKDVVFPGGITLDNKRIARLYTGLSDTCCGQMIIKNPFT